MTSLLLQQFYDFFFGQKNIVFMISRIWFDINLYFQLGFTNGPKPWLRVNENHVYLNVIAQETTDESVLKIFRKLVSLRNEHAIQFGTLHTTVVAYENVLVYAR